MAVTAPPLPLRRERGPGGEGVTEGGGVRYDWARQVGRRISPGRAELVSQGSFAAREANRMARAPRLALTPPRGA